MNHSTVVLNIALKFYQEVEFMLLTDSQISFMIPKLYGNDKKGSTSTANTCKECNIC